MPIWIRSQDKMTLVYANRIIAGGTRIINEVSYDSETDDYDFLGDYKTHKRALQVLNEIQDFVEKQTTYKHNYVYEMPEK